MFQYRGEYASNSFQIRSIPLLREMAGVIYDDGEIGAPESRDEDSKDDRVFAAALACRAWKDWVQPGMLSQGLTYDVVMNEESGNQTRIGRSIDGIVRGFLLTQIEQAEEARAMGPQPEKWRSDRGLV